MNRNTYRPAKAFRVFLVAVLIAGFILTAVPAPVAHAATFTVNSTADAVDASPGNGTCATAGGNCTLRAAIQEANALSGNDTLLLPSGTYTLTISGADDNASAGDLDFTSNVVISATGMTRPVIDGNGSVLNERVFDVTGVFTVTISGVVIQNGNALSDYGGGIFVASGGTLTLNTSLLKGNRSRCGNAIYSAGDLISNDSSLTENDFADTPYCSTMTAVNVSPGNMTLNYTMVGNNASGGGIYNEGTLTLNNSSVSGNTGHLVGGFYNYGNVTLNNSAISDNSVTVSGGGIYNYGTVTLNNSTVNNNTATQSGGGIFNTGLGTLNLNNSTVTDNTAGYGGGGGIYRDSGAVTMQNTILAGNTASATGPDCNGTIGSSGYNLIGNNSGCTITGTTTGNLTNVNPNLGPLIGSPGYQPLMAGSPAINAGNPGGCMGSAGLLTTDQRGAARVGFCDIGAYEYRTPGPAASITAFGGTPQHAPPLSPFATPLQALVLDSIGSPVNNVTVSFAAPASGASETFANTATYTTTAVTDGSGIATAAAFTANAITGSYSVTATVSGVITPATFSLGNLVWYVAPGGNDANNCQSPAAPCATINGALTKPNFLPGDTIRVAVGTYGGTGNEVVLLDKSAILSGGWDTTFTLQSGTSTVTGQAITP